MERLKRYRSLRRDGFTLRQAARRLEVSERTAWRYEADLRQEAAQSRLLRDPRSGARSLGGA